MKSSPVSNRNNTSALIEKLVSNAKPVRRIMSLSSFMMRWLGSAIFAVFVGTFVSGVRRDLEFTSFDSAIWLPIMIQLVMGGVAGAGAYLLGIPGRIESRSKALTAIMASMGLGQVVLLAWFSRPASILDLGIACLADVVLIALVPLLWVFSVIMTMAPHQKRVVGILLGISAGSIGMVSVSISCGKTGFLHVLFWHYFPVIGLAWLGSIAARKFLNWSKSKNL